MFVSLTDEELIDQILPAQPSQCFESLSNRYVDKVYRRCLSMTRDSDKAQGFTQDIFLKVFDKLETFQQKSSFSSWLYSISYNYCLDQLRRNKLLSTTSIDPLCPPDIADSQEAYLREETLQFVRRAMAMLSAQERALLTLKYEQGMCIEEIAHLHALKPAAVKMRLKRSRIMIQKLHSQRSIV